MCPENQGARAAVGGRPPAMKPPKCHSLRGHCDFFSLFQHPEPSLPPPPIPGPTEEPSRVCICTPGRKSSMWCCPTPGRASSKPLLPTNKTVSHQTRCAVIWGEADKEFSSRRVLLTSGGKPGKAHPTMAAGSHAYVSSRLEPRTWPSKSKFIQ